VVSLVKSKPEKVPGRVYTVTESELMALQELGDEVELPSLDQEDGQEDGSSPIHPDHGPHSSTVSVTVSVTVFPSTTLEIVFVTVLLSLYLVFCVCQVLVRFCGYFTSVHVTVKLPTTELLEPAFNEVTLVVPEEPLADPAGENLQE